jgi:hypothetical protein
MALSRKLSLGIAAFFVLISVAIIVRGLYFGGFIVSVPNTAVWVGGEGNHTVELEEGQIYATWATDDPYSHFTVWSEDGSELDTGPSECDSDCEYLGGFYQRGGFTGEESISIDVTRGEVAILVQEDAHNLPSTNSNPIANLAFYAHISLGLPLLILSVISLKKNMG